MRPDEVRHPASSDGSSVRQRHGKEVGGGIHDRQRREVRGLQRQPRREPDGQARPRKDRRELGVFGLVVAVADIR